MPSSRTQQCYDHRLRNLVQHTGDLRLASACGVPKSTARGWMGRQPGEVVGLADLTRRETELRCEVMILRRRVGKLAALLRLALALRHASGFRLARTRLPEGPAKARMLRAIDQARTQMPLRGVLASWGSQRGACRALVHGPWALRSVDGRVSVGAQAVPAR